MVSLRMSGWLCSETKLSILRLLLRNEADGVSIGLIA